MELVLATDMKQVRRLDQVLRLRAASGCPWAVPMAGHRDSSMPGSQLLFIDWYHHHLSACLPPHTSNPPLRPRPLATFNSTLSPSCPFPSTHNPVLPFAAPSTAQHFAITTSFLHKLANRPQHDGGQLSGSSHQGSNGNSTSGRGQQAQGGLEEEVWDEETEVLVLKVG